MQNLYNSGGFFWWNGVVEDRIDPLLLGRCRVRILGYHNPNKTELPVEDLPWAYPMQAITSAAMNGIGHSPVGPVEGTWVIGFFRDGDDCQEPVMMGTIGGVPQVDETLYETRNPTQAESVSPAPPVTDPSGNVYVNKSTNESVPATPDTVVVPTPTDGIVGPLNQVEVTKLMAAIAKRESGGNYGICNQYGFIGAYQMSGGLLADYGYIQQGAYAQHKNAGLQDYAITAQNNNWIVQTYAYATMPDSRKGNFSFFCLATDTIWTQKSGGSAAAFLKNKQAQDDAMLQNLKVNYRFLYRSNIVNSSTSKGEVAGYLAICHLVGPGGAKNYHNGVIKQDANGTTSASYYNIGYKAIGGATGSSIAAGTAVKSPDQIQDQKQPVAPPTPSNLSNQTQNTDVVQTNVNIGFADPNKVYPKTQFIGEPDTSRLARHQKIALTLVGEKDANRVLGVALPLEQGHWDQPVVPYNAKYPFNHVFESESGHVVEYDDTPGNERTHHYHKSGTFTEVDANGTRVTRIIGDEFTLLERNGYVSILGSANVTIGGPCNVKIESDCNLEVDGKVSALFHNDVTVGIAGDLKLAVGGNIDVASKGHLNVKTDTDLNLKANTIKIESTTSVSMKSGTLISVAAGTDLGFKSGTKLMLWAGAILALDGSGLALMSGVALTQTPATSATDASAGNAGDKLTPTPPVFPVLQTPNRAEEFAYVLDGLTENIDSNADAIKEVKAKAIADGTVNEEDFLKEPTPGIIDTKKVAPRKPVDPGCGDIGGLSEYPGSTKLSKYFTLRMLSSDAAVTKVPVQELHGLSKQQIVCNLQALATQVLDPIREHYPNVIVTSGFRTPSHSKAVNSQHEFGKAADLQFTGVPKNGYLEIAQWIRDNLGFDQLLLEFKSYASGNPWIHVSYTTDTLRADVKTMYNDRAYPNSGARVLVDLSGGVA